jgi:tetratricopeptide (TPR) repeat protein
MSHFEQCRLEPLLDDSALELLDSLLGRDPGLDALKQDLVDRTEGNPFFLEESVRELVEQGVLMGSFGSYRLAELLPPPRVPATVQATLAARIDRLSAQEKDLLLAAAVIGRHVDAQLLRVVTDLPEEDLQMGLSRLHAAEFLQEPRHVAPSGYVFRHALTQEVAYANVLHDQRRLLSRRIVAALEARGGDGKAAWHERLAWHAFNGELWEKAVAHYRILGDRSLERSANAESANAYRRALEALSHLADDSESSRKAIDIRLELANALFAFGESKQVFDVVREAQDLAEQIGDQHRLARVHSAMTLHDWMVGDPVRAISSGRQARKVAEDLNDFDLMVLSTLRLAVALQAHGDYRDTVELFSWAVDAIKDDKIRHHFGLTSIAAVAARTSLARSFAELGRFEEGVGIAEEGVQLSDALEHPFTRVYAAREAGLFYIRKGDFERAIGLLEEGFRLCEETGNQVLFPVCAATLGYARVLCGETGEGLILLERAAERSLAMNLMVRLSLQLSWLSEAYLLAGRHSDALAQGIRAVGLARRYEERGHLGWALRVLGEAYRCSQPAAISEAERHYREALTVAEELEMLVLQAHCRLGLGMLYQATGDVGEAQSELQSSMQLFRDMGMATWLQRTRSIAGTAN